MAASAMSGHSRPAPFIYYAIRSVNSPEDIEAGRRRFCGVAPANSFFGIGTDENVRAYLGRDQDGTPRKSTKVNIAIRDTLARNREEFSLLNAGIVMVARDVKVEDNAKPPRVILTNPSIINGAQTQGALRDYFAKNEDDNNYPSVNFELIITDDEELVGDISIARNYQNEVTDLSIFGRQGRFEALQKALKESDPTIKLRTKKRTSGTISPTPRNWFRC